MPLQNIFLWLNLNKRVINCNSASKGSTGDSLEFIGEGEKLVHESSSGDLIDFASMYERIVTDYFGCTFSFANSVFDLFRSVFLAFDRVVCKTF